MADSVKSIVLDRILPFFRFGQRWLLLVPVVAIPALLIAVKEFLGMPMRRALLHPAFVVGSGAVLILCFACYVRRTGSPLRDRFRIVIASFHQVGAEPQLEADKLRDRLVDELRSSLRPARTRIDIRAVADKIDGRSKEGQQRAEDLAEEYRAHIVLGGTVRVDEEYFFAPFIVTRFSHPFEVMLGENRSAKIESAQSLRLKELKVSDEVRLAALVTAIALIDAGWCEEAEQILAGIPSASAEGLFYRGIAQLQMGQVRAALGSFRTAADADDNFSDAWTYAAISALKLRDQSAAQQFLQNALSTTGGVLISRQETHRQLLKSLQEDFIKTLEEFGTTTDLQDEMLRTRSEQALRQMDALTPANEGVQHFKAMQYAAAAEKFAAALKLDPTCNVGWDKHAVALVKLGRTDEARTILQGALARPRDGFGEFYVAVVYAALREKSPMLSHLATAIVLNPLVKGLAGAERELHPYHGDSDFEKVVRG